MERKRTGWSKAELEIYILLLCAKVDKIETEEELGFIKSKTSEDIFKKIYDEFCLDDEDRCLEKIQDALKGHEYSYKELVKLKKEIQNVFSSDKKILMAETNLSRILDNILY